MIHLDDIDLGNLDLVHMADVDKQDLLDQIAMRFLELRVEFVDVAAKHAAMKTEMALLNACKSSLQTSLRVAVRLAEG